MEIIQFWKDRADILETLQQNVKGNIEALKGIEGKQFNKSLFVGSNKCVFQKNLNAFQTRYVIVSLEVKELQGRLGESKDQEGKRFHALERKLTRNPEF